MAYKINKAVVIGAGTMGAGIAAHLANAGVRVTLLDIVPNKLDAKEEKLGLTLKDKAVRNRIVNAGYTAAVKSRPASFFTDRQQELVSLGNLEDDFSAVGEADWVIEAIVENLKIKQGLMAKIDDVRKENAIVSTNTSGIPIQSIVEGRSAGFKKHFLGTHFFNPPRYMKLLEIIRGVDTLPEVVDAIAAFGATHLGKGIVYCKDTPNFIANRIGSVAGAFAMDFIVENGYSVPEVDSVTGPLMGNPKTATFRLLDLVGIDIANHVRSNLAELIPQDAAAQKVLTSKKGNAVSEKMIEKGWLGNKTNQGFYKTVRQNGKKDYWPLNLETLEYEAPGEKPKFDSVGRAKDEENLGDRLKILLAGEDRAADLVRALVFHGVSYASACVPEVTEMPSAIDDAMRWGFMREAGPFEMWDMLGVKDTIGTIKESGYKPAAWVDEMLAAGNETFYQYEGQTKVAIYNPVEKAYKPLVDGEELINFPRLRAESKIVASNDGATLFDLGDGIAGMEMHTKMGVLDEDIYTMVGESLDKVDQDFDGMVLSTAGEHFSAGANLFLVVMMAQQGQWKELETAIRTLQGMNMRMRYSSKPVVIAPVGYNLGGGSEITMHASRVVAASEVYSGLVEVGMGLIPAGGGTKEMIRRVLNPAMRIENTDALPFLEKLFMQVGMAKVATSAEEARHFGILTESDRIVMNRDHLLAEAKREARHMADFGYMPPAPEKLYAAGRDMLSALRVGIYMFREGGYISEYDALVGEKLAYILTGGDLSQPQWVTEQYILDLEVEAFLSLCGEQKTQDRIWHFLQKGKPLRN